MKIIMDAKFPYRAVVPHSKEGVRLQIAENVVLPCEVSHEHYSLSCGLRWLSREFQSILLNHDELHGVRPCSRHHLWNSQPLDPALDLHNNKITRLDYSS